MERSNIKARQNISFVLLRRGRWKPFGQASYSQSDTLIQLYDITRMVEGEHQTGLIYLRDGSKIEYDCFYTLLNRICEAFLDAYSGLDEAEDIHGKQFYGHTLCKAVEKEYVMRTKGLSEKELDELGIYEFVTDSHPQIYMYKEDLREKGIDI